MTTLDLYDNDAATIASAPARQGLGAALKRAWNRFLRRRAERRMVYTLASLDDRLLKDIGVEPQDVAAALAGRRAESILFNPMLRRPDHR
jgi:uncharacterized protein YjiS (DUF1127 family)